MNITFHPSRVRTREQIAAADRHRAVQNLISERESLLLTQDGNSVSDYHNGVAEVAARVESHFGYAKRGGGLHIQTVTEENTEQLQRSDDGTRLTLSRVTGKEESQETFSMMSDGSISYTKEVKEAQPPAQDFVPVTYQLGAVSSPVEVEAHETYLMMNDSFALLEELVGQYDGSSEYDFNESPGILAGDNVPAGTDLAFQDIVSNSGDEPLRKRLLDEANGSSRKPSMNGYVEPGGEISAKTNWKRYPTESLGIETFYQRAADGSRGFISSKLKDYVGKVGEQAEYLQTTDGQITLNRNHQVGEQS